MQRRRLRLGCNGCTHARKVYSDARNIPTEICSADCSCSCTWGVSMRLHDDSNSIDAHPLAQQAPVTCSSRFLPRACSGQRAPATSCMPAASAAAAPAAAAPPLQRCQWLLAVWHCRLVPSGDVGVLLCWPVGRQMRRGRARPMPGLCTAAPPDLLIPAGRWRFGCVRALVAVGKRWRDGKGFWRPPATCARVTLLVTTEENALCWRCEQPFQQIGSGQSFTLADSCDPSVAVTAAPHARTTIPHACSRRARWLLHDS